LNVLHILKDLKKQCTAIIITSDKSYRNFELSRGYRENDILGGDDPYSASKAASEMMIRSYVNCFFKNKKNKKRVLIGIARAGNVIGGGDWSSDRLVPDCIKFWSKKKKVILRNPRSTRPWQFVLEVIWGYILFAIKLRKNSNLHGEVFNFGPGPNVNKNVLEVVKEMKKHWEDVDWKISTNNKKIESTLLKLNSSKAKSILKWNTLLNFKETIKVVVDWYKNFYIIKKNNLDFSTKQILNYQKKIYLKL
jgi:CDP-glucose 4,6-dehydratase